MKILGQKPGRTRNHWLKWEIFFVQKLTSKSTIDDKNKSRGAERNSEKRRGWENSTSDRVDENCGSGRGSVLDV